MLLVLLWVTRTLRRVSFGKSYDVFDILLGVSMYKCCIQINASMLSCLESS